MSLSRPQAKGHRSQTACSLLLCDKMLSNVREMLSLLEGIARAGRPLLAIGEDAAVVVADVKKGKGTYGYNAATGELGGMPDMGDMGDMGM